MPGIQTKNDVQTGLSNEQYEEELKRAAKRTSMVAEMAALVATLAFSSMDDGLLSSKRRRRSVGISTNAKRRRLGVEEQDVSRMARRKTQFQNVPESIEVPSALIEVPTVAVEKAPGMQSVEWGTSKIEDVSDLEN
mmetsp:Transcript_17218/g.29658  ORF Transcript_17218/g.29658 Transcript_17218/m.29658 type:complete len:136 (+) Transcript_17218:147-554(+)